MEYNERGCENLHLGGDEKPQSVLRVNAVIC